MANGKSLSFTYDDQGMRLTKTVDGVTHTYSLDGDRIVAEEWGNQLLVYFYDDAGLPMGMMYRNSSYADKQFDYYLYEKDVFGNIIAIYNEAGTKVASYCYDAWGNCTVLTNVNGIGAMNPFRYRGYYLDTETNLYYLQSRYYDSYVGRFINADDVSTVTASMDALTDKNLFSYCDNNPVMRTDEDGEFWHLIIGAAVGAIVGGVSAALQGKSGVEIAIAAGAGALGGLLTASGAGMAVQIIGSATIAAAESYLSQGVTKGFDNIDYADLAMDTIAGGISGIGGGIDKGVSQHLMTQGTQATKRVWNELIHKGLSAAGTEIGKAGKYYFSQTATLYYKPLIKNAIKSLFKETEMAILNKFILSVS